MITKKIIFSFTYILIFATLSNAQINVTNSSHLKTKNVNILPSNTISKKLSTNELKHAIADKIELQKLTKISIPSKEELERNRIKKWEITPKKPFISGFGFNFYGMLDETNFKLIPRQNERGYFLYCGFINTSMTNGKNYVLTFDINKFTENNFETILEIGLERYRITINANQQKYILPFEFKSNGTYAGHNGIVMSPAINFLSRTATSVDMKPIEITKIQLEEVE